jgi:hypothetical protein
VDGFRESEPDPDPWWICEEGREDRERVDVVDGAPEARLDIAGEGGAGRLDVRGDVAVEVDCESGRCFVVADTLGLEIESRVDTLMDAR